MVLGGCNELQFNFESLKSASEVTPDKICLGDKKNKVTYKQFWKMINKGASFLEENGVKKGDVVVLKGAQKVEYLFAMFSIQLLGAVACPLERLLRKTGFLKLWILLKQIISLIRRN